MILTERERQEWRRTEKVLRERGCTTEANILHDALNSEPLSLSLFDRAGYVYRAWLCFDEPNTGSLTFTD